MTVRGRSCPDTSIPLYAVDREGGERHRRPVEPVGQGRRLDGRGHP